jgi:hypothetical protein
VDVGADDETGVGVGVVESLAEAGATTAASERPAARTTAVKAARVFFMVFGFSLGEGSFLGTRPKATSGATGDAP